MQQKSLFVKIDSIKTVQKSQEMIDISIDTEDKLFKISSTGNDWILTHNSEFPDIDTDFAHRDVLVEKLKEEFSGKADVIPITNFNLFQLKSLIKDVSRLYGVDFDVVNAVTVQLDADVRPYAIAAGENKSLFQLKYDDCLNWSPGFKKFIDDYPIVGQNIRELFKQLKGYGKHAGGVIVIDDAAGKMPVITIRGQQQTPWPEGMNYKGIEKTIGLCKFDLLGLDTLRIIQRCIELILEKDEKLEIELENGKKVSMFSYEEVPLVSGIMKRVGDLTENDEIDDEYLQTLLL